MLANKCQNSSLAAAKETALHARGYTGFGDVGKPAGRMGYSAGASDRLMCWSTEQLILWPSCSYYAV